MVQEYHFGGLLSSIQHSMNRHFNRRLEELGLTVAQLTVLHFIVDSHGGEINQRDIERGFQLSNPTVTGILQRLEAKNFIERKPSKSDLRSKMISPTDEAMKLAKQMKENMKLMEDNLTKGFTADEKYQLWKLLEKLSGNLMSAK